MVTVALHSSGNCVITPVTRSLYLIPSLEPPEAEFLVGTWFIFGLLREGPDLTGALAGPQAWLRNLRDMLGDFFSFWALNCCLQL